MNHPQRGILHEMSPSKIGTTRDSGPSDWNSHRCYTRRNQTYGIFLLQDTTLQKALIWDAIFQVGMKLNRSNESSQL